jgi:hypothetical protein
MKAKQPFSSPGFQRLSNVLNKESQISTEHEQNQPMNQPYSEHLTLQTNIIKRLGDRDIFTSTFNCGQLKTNSTVKKMK